MNVSNFERTVRKRTKTACVVPLPVAVRDRDVPLSTVSTDYCNLYSTHCEPNVSVVPVVCEPNKYENIPYRKQSKCRA